MRRRNVGVFCCLLCLVLACSTMMFGCGKAKQEEQKSLTDQKTEKTDEPEETGDDVAALLKKAKYVAVIHVKINPEFNIYLDQDENVVALECLNEDAKDAYGKKSFAGKSLDETLQTVVSIAAEKGYMKEDQTVALTITECTTDLNATELQTKMDSVVTEAAKEQDITVTTAMDMSEEVRTAQKEAGLIKQACSNCNGTGDCPDCDGGRMTCPACGGDGIEECGNCFGTGLDHGKTCTFCGGAKTHTCTHCGGVGTAMDCPVCGGSFKCVVCGGSGTL